MQPKDAIAYLAQVCSDYGRTLPPSAAGPFQSVAQDAINSLVSVIDPPAEPAPPGEREPLRAVPTE